MTLLFNYYAIYCIHNITKLQYDDLLPCVLSLTVIHNVIIAYWICTI